tara:strand:+ start:6778 stop:7182 length:405 start_codon:yes stop_codon:yes gene_type:complete
MVSILARGLASVLLSISLTATQGGSLVPMSIIPIATAEAPTSADSFAGYSTLRKICTCESGLNHFDKNGDVLRGVINKSDIGICQINEYYHSKEISALDIDIYTEEGNISFAKHLYDRQGSAPWIWSKSCWANS